MIGPWYDSYLQLVANDHRRRIIRYLRHETDGEATVDELAEQLSVTGSVSDDGPRNRRGFVVQLHHLHLPKLANHGVVDYDPGSGTVRYRPDEQIEAVLDSLPDELPVADA